MVPSQFSGRKWGKAHLIALGMFTSSLAWQGKEPVWATASICEIKHVPLEKNFMVFPLQGGAGNEMWKESELIVWCSPKK